MDLLKLYLENKEKFETLFIVLAVVLVLRFILEAIGVFLLARKKLVKAPYTALIPILSPAAIGAIREKCDMKYGNEKHTSSFLICFSVLKTAFLIAFCASLYSSIEGILYSANEAIKNNTVMEAEAFTPTVLPLLLLILTAVTALVFAVSYYIYLFKVYKSQVSASLSALLLILSILSPLAKAIILLCLGIKAKPQTEFQTV